MHLFFTWNRYIRRKWKREQRWYKEKNQDKRQSYGQMNGQKCMSYSLIQQQAGRKFVSELPLMMRAKKGTKLITCFRMLIK